MDLPTRRKQTYESNKLRKYLNALNESNETLIIDQVKILASVKLQILLSNETKFLWRVLAGYLFQFKLWKTCFFTQKHII